MKVIDLVKVIYPTTEIEFFDFSGQTICFCANTLDIPPAFWYREIAQISTSEEGTLEILLKKI